MSKSAQAAFVPAVTTAREGGPEDVTKVPLSLLALRTLVFDGRQGAYPTLVEQQFRGPLAPGGLCAPSLRSRSPEIRRREPTRALAPHSFATASPLQGPSQSRISTQVPGQTFSLGCYIITHARFSPGGGGATGLLAAPGHPPGTPSDPVSTRLGGLPPPPDPRCCPPTARLGEAAAADAPRVLSFCFRSLLSAAGKTAEEQSGE